MRRLLLAFGLGMSFLGVPAHSADRADRVDVTPDSDRAVVIIRTDELAPPLNMASGFHLTIAPYDAEHESLGGSIFGGRGTFKARPSRFVDGYLVLEMKPGTYVVQQFTRQDSWALCYSDASVQFTLEAGEAVYLGDFDALASLVLLEAKAVSTGRLSTSGELIHFFDVPPPKFAEVTGEALAAAQEMADTHMPRMTSPVSAVRFSPARFGTGSDLFGLNRVCGGYYSGSAENG